ncbi:MAG: sulfatase-like hydrolase/transferase [Caldiserica bacterium]|nr:sulfatase-like hydrolase/transferase [Caldisericota bacterium]
MKRINVLHIMTHNTGRHLECCGADVRTPNINRRAEEGVRFTNCFCTAPQCATLNSINISKEFFRRRGYYNKRRSFEYLSDIIDDPLERENLLRLSEYDRILKEMRKKLIA